MSAPGRGQSDKTVSSARNGHEKTAVPILKDVLNDSEISCDPANDPTIHDIRTEMKIMKAELIGKIDALAKVVEKKDKSLAQLNQQVGALNVEINLLKTENKNLRENLDNAVKNSSELRANMVKNASVNESTITELKKKSSEMEESLNFVTNETTVLNTKMNMNAAESSSQLAELKNKTVDLEDRSRRCNLVFFGVPELSSKTVTEDCDTLIKNIIIKQGIVSPDCGDLFERAHRLGARKPDQARPRPIIVKVAFYKDKLHILYNAKKFSGTPFSVSEDFSKSTLSVRSQLVSCAKRALETCGPMKSFKLSYTRLICKYENPDTKRVFFKVFNLPDVLNNPNWYLPQNHQRPAANSV